MIREISHTDLMLVPGSWPFADHHHQEIETHWARSLQNNPYLWNGKMLAARAPTIENGCLSAEFVAVNYADYLAWRDWDYPDKSHFSIFGTALIRSREGHLIFGVMGDHTSWPGRIYPPAGSLELSDTGPDGRLDAFASGARELREETGINVHGLLPEQSLVSWAGQQISVTQVFTLDCSSDELVKDIAGFISTETRSELANIQLITCVEDLDIQNTEPDAIQIAQYLLR